jgi:membrane-associated protease RseP (regulator of RpoE activity)
MITILAAALLAAPQEAVLDRVPFQPDSTAPATIRLAPASADGAFLGVGIASGGEARVSNVVPRSAAAVAGLAVGDVILAIDDEPVTAGGDVSAAMANRAPGDVVAVRVRRGADELVLDAVLGRRSAGAAMAPATPGVPAAPVAPRILDLVPPPPAAPRSEERVQPGFLGVMATEVEGGIAIQSVNTGGPADGSGLAAGDVVVAIEGRSIESLEGLVDVLGELGAGRRVDVDVLRDGEELSIALELGARPGAAAEVDEDVFTLDAPLGALPRTFSGGQGFRIAPDGSIRILDAERVLDADGMMLFDLAPKAEGSTDEGRGDRADDEAARDLRREFRHRLEELRQRHRAELEELRAEMHETLEAHGLSPRLLDLGDLGGMPGLRIDRSGGDGGGAGSGRRGLQFFDDGRLFELELGEGLGAGGGLRRGIERLDQRGPARLQGGGQQEIVEVEVLPDGQRIERRRRAELRDGEWTWVEESVTEHPAGSATAPQGRTAEIDAILQDVRRQIEELERRAAELRESQRP